jgi:hypothetical protein
MKQSLRGKAELGASSHDPRVGQVRPASKLQSSHLLLLATFYLILLNYAAPITTLSFTMCSSLMVSAWNSILPLALRSI